MSVVVPMRTAVSSLVERIRFGRVNGLLTFGGKRDVSGALGYANQISPRMYRARYERNEVAATVVEAMPNAVWRGDGELVEDENPDVVTEFEAAWRELADRLRIWPVLRRADILAGLGRYAVVLIGAPGTLESELPRMRGPEDVKFLSVYAEDDLTIDENDYVGDPASPRFGFPDFYRVSNLVPSSKSARKVHWTRVLHVADGLVDDELFGQPRMQRVWNRLDDLEKVVGSGAEAFWQRVQRGMQVDIDKDVFTDLTASGKLEETKKQMEAELDEYVNSMRRYIRTTGVKINELGSDVANFDRQIDAIIGLIAAGTRIPKRILLGSERGELASSQDKENWDERVQDRREHYAEPFIVRPFVDRLIEKGALPTPAQYGVRWPEIQDLDEDHRASIALKYSQANQANGSPIVTENEIRDRVLGLPPLDIVTPDSSAIASDSGGEGEPVPAAAASGESAVHHAADRHIPRVRRVFAAAARAAASTVDVRALERTFSDGTAAAADRVLAPAMAAFEDALAGFALDEQVRAAAQGGGLDDALLSALADGARSVPLCVQGADGPQGRCSIGSAEIRFDIRNPEALRWATEHAAELVRQVSAESRLAVRSAVSRAFAEAIPPREAARLIREIVGLTDAQARAVGNLRARLMKAAETAERVERQTARYAERLLKQRAFTIARTETLRASNEGQRQLWLQAQDKGLLPADARRVWITTDDDRVCEICEPLEGATAPLSGRFEGGYSAPPAHPQCRCTTAIARRAT